MVINTLLPPLVHDISSNKQIIWAPIRHHSPQCSLQLARLIALEKPDVILIEGPSEAEHLIPHLANKATKPPVAVYIYATDKKQHWARAEQAEHEINQSAVATRYRCYIPFSAMSPEWLAIQAAKKLGVDAHFIDLPYEQRLALVDDRLAFTKGNDSLLYGDSLLANADPVKALLEQSQCRDFDEWWDRHFESGRNIECPKTYFREMMEFCLLMRRGLLEPDSNSAETLAREAFMAKRISSHVQQGQRCLVVCGGFHCLGIHHFLQHPSADIALKNNPTDIESGVHLIPYSMVRLNKATGYAAGLPDCGYYEEYWSMLSQESKVKKTTAYTGIPENNFAQLNIKLAKDLVNNLRQKNYIVSMPDAIESALMSERLAALRGNKAGRSEFRDSIVSCFLKQARDGSESNFNLAVDQLLSGKAIGKLPDGLPSVPIVEDFREVCKKFKLPLLGLAASEKSLNIYKSLRHRQISRFLHQLNYLDIGYAEHKAGPNFLQATDLDRVREVWSINWNVEVEPRLIECSYLGTNLADATLQRILSRLYNHQVSGDAKVTLLLTALNTGLHDMLGPITDEIKRWLHQETQLLPLSRGLHQLSICYMVKGALDVEGLVDLEQILTACFERLCTRLPWLSILSEEEADILSTAITNMYSLVRNEASWCDKHLFYDALKTLTSQQINWKISGVSTGILFSQKWLNLQQTSDIFTEAFSYANLSADIAGSFLQGFLQVARSALTAEPELLAMVSEQVLSWDEDEFLTSLPALRLAFAQLNPRETQELATQLKPNNAASLPLDLTLTLSDDDLSKARYLQQQLPAALQRWGSL